MKTDQLRSDQLFMKLHWRFRISLPKKQYYREQIPAVTANDISASSHTQRGLIHIPYLHTEVSAMHRNVVNAAIKRFAM